MFLMFIAKRADEPRNTEYGHMGERLKGKTAIVTGAGSSGPGWGNGKATAVLFAREGANILAVDINQNAADETQTIIESEGGICATHRADLVDAIQVKDLVQRCIDTYGQIDILHNNVGIVEVGGPVETSEESWDRVCDVNLKSMFLTCKYVLPYMESGGRGAIVNISSIAGIRYLGVPLYWLQHDQGRNHQLHTVNSSAICRQEHPCQRDLAWPNEYPHDHRAAQRCLWRR